MNKIRILLLAAGCSLPILALAQTNVLSPAFSLTDQVYAQLTPSVQDWAGMEGREMVRNGGFNDPAVTADIQLHFKDQRLGVPEVEALKFAALAQAVRAAGASVRAAQIQLNDWQQAQIHPLIVQSDVPNAVGPHRSISLDTDPGRTAALSNLRPITAPVVAPPPDNQTGSLLTQRLQRARIVLAKLTEAFKQVEGQAATIGDARLAGLK